MASATGSTGSPSLITVWLKSIYLKFLNFYGILNEAKTWKFHHYNAVKTNILAAQYNRKQSTEHKLKRK